MKHRLLILVIFALLLAIAPAAAQDTEPEPTPAPSKDIVNLHASTGTGAQTDTSVPWFCFHWEPPTSPARMFAKKSYRVDWSLNNSGFPSYKKSNTDRVGTVFVGHLNLPAGYDYGGKCFVTAAANVYTDPITGVHTLIKWPIGETLRIRIRARYPGEANGDWTRASVTRTGKYTFSSPDIDITH